LNKNITNLAEGLYNSCNSLGIANGKHIPTPQPFVRYEAQARKGFSKIQ
jgi:hypothetical protein